MVCNTSAGAGAGLVWIVTVDGQLSVSPSTNYGPPIISTLSGAGAQDASTNGNSAVVIGGSYFATQSFLGAVTYGPSGLEFAATGCFVSTPHYAITCYTVPGTGRSLKWMVTVGGQASLLSPVASSYAAPNITSVSPSRCVTSGGAAIVISGTNLGLAYAASKLSIKLNNLMFQPPTRAQWTAYRTALLAAQPSPSAAVDAWLASLYTVPALTVARSGNVESVSFIAPPGFGPAAELIVVVDGVPSDSVPFVYDPPAITNLAPDRTNLTRVGTLNIWIDGSSLCASSSCGSVLFNGEPPLSTPVWTHTQVRS
jgi:hypothetical protein